MGRARYRGAQLIWGRESSTGSTRLVNAVLLASRAIPGLREGGRNGHRVHGHVFVVAADATRSPDNARWCALAAVRATFSFLADGPRLAAAREEWITTSDAVGAGEGRVSGREATDTCGMQGGEGWGDGGEEEGEGALEGRGGGRVVRGREHGLGGRRRASTSGQ